MSLSALLTDRATVLVESFAGDSYGEPLATPTVEAADLPCLQRPLSAERLTRQGRDGSTRMSRLYFAARPFPEDDARRRLVQIGDRTYRPVDALDAGGQGRLWQVDCELVTG